MRKRNAVPVLGIASIIILISVQVFLIQGIWQQKEEMFTLRYTLLSQEALNFISTRFQTDGFDTVRFVLSKYSESANSELHTLKDQQQLSVKKEDILDFFTRVLNQEQDLSALLANYFDRRGYDRNFNYSIVIDNLEMISHDTISVYQSENYANRRSFRRSVRPRQHVVPGSRILVNRFTEEDNNYRLFFEYYIDFSDKRNVILKESAASLTMSILSILIVVIIFIVAYRNLMEEKRLSGLKTDFINNMTHELKTPLSTITVAGKTLELEKIRNNEVKVSETAKLIGKQSILLNKLINMILEISLWERSQFQLDKKKVDIEELMKDIVDSFKSGTGVEASINQKYNFSGVKVDLDVVYFTTLINNLLSNAIKYSENNPKIDIEGFTSEKHVLITVADNGIGISRNDQKNIFDKFYRASTGNIHKFKGLGLGLYYVKKIAEAHDGDISVLSKPGKGSVFTLMLPYQSNT